MPPFTMWASTVMMNTTTSEENSQLAAEIRNGSWKT